MKTVLWLLGGLCAGTGVLTAVSGGFGEPGGPAAVVYPRLGFDGLDNLTISGQGWLAIALFVLGIAMMAVATSTAWKETGGY